MYSTLADFIVGEIGIIEEIPFDSVPLKLLEMGCLPGKEVELLQIAPLKDPLYIKVNGSHLAIRKETASLIKVTKIKNLCDILKS
ncbi:ferrous iron transport protein A [Aureibaculum marinum]|uniref:Ferrous iron transport protein A n=1 Tax=Aureibaculum marinum TaxID=2487930 RepID=A0A3N4PKQ7_9FLAO|nr:FeoA family protein [Aureibaculum marinum]RPE00194.1 ferrous iron transport protein A [Aureibaculum marinum]